MLSNYLLVKRSLWSKTKPESGAKVLKCHKTTVKRWLDRWEETKDLSDRIRSGTQEIHSYSRILSDSDRKLSDPIGNFREPIRSCGIRVSDRLSDPRCWNPIGSNVGNQRNPTGAYNPCILLMSNA